MKMKKKLFQQLVTTHQIRRLAKEIDLVSMVTKFGGREKEKLVGVFKMNWSLGKVNRHRERQIRQMCDLSANRCDLLMQQMRIQNPVNI